MENLQGSLAGLVCYHDHPTLAVLMQPVQSPEAYGLPASWELGWESSSGRKPRPRVSQSVFFKVRIQRKGVLKCF